MIELYKDIYQSPFTEADLLATQITTAWMGTAIQQNRERLILQKQRELNTYLIDLLKCYFSNTIFLDKALFEIVVSAP